MTLYTMDYAADLVYLVDLVWKFFLGYYALGVVVTSQSMIAHKYLRGKFVLDLVSVLPFDFVHWRDPQVHAFLRLNRLVKLLLVPEMLRPYEDLSRLSSPIRYGRLFFVSMLVAHWGSCSFFAAIKQQNKDSKGVWPDGQDGWSQGLEVNLKKPVSVSYPRCLYWVLCFITGMGTSPTVSRTLMEVWFSLVMVFVGIFVFAGVIGAFRSSIASGKQTENAFRKKMDILKFWMRFKAIQPSLQRRILLYYDYLWKQQAGLKDSAVADDLPSHIRLAVHSELSGAAIARVPLFAGGSVSTQFIATLAQQLKMEVFTPGDFILREGDYGDSMYFIARGICEVLTGGEVVAVLEANSFVGDMALMQRSRRTVSLRARTFVDAYVLHRSAVDRTLVDFPEHAAPIYARAHDLLQSAAFAAAQAMATTTAGGAASGSASPAAAGALAASSLGSTTAGRGGGGSPASPDADPSSGDPSPFSRLTREDVARAATVSASGGARRPELAVVGDFLATLDYLAGASPALSRMRATELRVARTFAVNSLQSALRALQAQRARADASPYFGARRESDSSALSASGEAV